LLSDIHERKHNGSGGHDGMVETFFLLLPLVPLALVADILELSNDGVPDHLQ
jgi:hypothetical protein